MKKLLYILPFLLLLLSCDNTPQKVDATVVLGTPDGFAVTCATNYSRTVPHFCSNSTNTIESWNQGAACATRTLTSIPASTKAILLMAEAQITSNNAIGTRGLLVSMWVENTCVTPEGFGFNWNVREEVAVAAGTVLLLSRELIVAYVHNGQLFISESRTGGVNTFTQYYVMGYYD